MCDNCENPSFGPQIAVLLYCILSNRNWMILLIPENIKILILRNRILLFIELDLVPLGLGYPPLFVAVVEDRRWRWKVGTIWRNQPVDQTYTNLFPSTFLRHFNSFFYDEKRFLLFCNSALSRSKYVNWINNGQWAMATTVERCPWKTVIKANYIFQILHVPVCRNAFTATYSPILYHSCGTRYVPM